MRNLDKLATRIPFVRICLVALMLWSYFGTVVDSSLGENKSVTRLKFISIQSTGYGGRGCLPGYMGIDILVESDQIKRLKYHDLKGRTDRLGPLSEKERADLAKYISALSNLTDKRTWQVEKGFCQFELRAGVFSYSWKNRPVEIPFSVITLVLWLREKAGAASKVNLRHRN